MKNAAEALDWLVASCQESIPTGDSESYELLNKAHGLLTESLASPREEELAEVVKAVMSLIEQGASYYAGVYENLSVRIRIVGNTQEKMANAVAIAETAGAASSLGALFAHLISEDSKTFHKVEDIFTGAGLTYPKVLGRGKQLVKLDDLT